MGGCQKSRKKHYITLEWPLTVQHWSFSRLASVGPIEIWCCRKNKNILERSFNFIMQYVIMLYTFSNKQDYQLLFFFFEFHTLPTRTIIFHPTTAKEWIALPSCTISTIIVLKNHFRRGWPTFMCTGNGYWVHSWLSFTFYIHTLFDQHCTCRNCWPGTTYL